MRIPWIVSLQFQWPKLTLQIFPISGVGVDPPDSSSTSVVRPSMSFYLLSQTVLFQIPKKMCWFLSYYNHSQS